MPKTAKNPFHFYTHLELRESTGLKAQNARELVNIIKGAPDSVIYYHTHVFSQKHQFVFPEPSNAFAYWVSHILGEEELGEELGSLDICQFHSIRQLREKIIEIIEKFLFDAREIRNAPDSKGFDFIKSRTFILPTPHIAYTLEELIAGLKRVSLGSIDFHIFEARFRLAKGVNDFSCWLDTGLGYPELGACLENFDPYTYTLEGIRHRIIEIITNSTEWKIEHGQ